LIQKKKIGPTMDSIRSLFQPPMLLDDQAKILIFLCFEAKISQALLIIESKKLIQNVATSGDINATYIYRNRSRFACLE